VHAGVEDEVLEDREILPLIERLDFRSRRVEEVRSLEVAQVADDRREAGRGVERAWISVLSGALTGFSRPRWDRSTVSDHAPFPEFLRIWLLRSGVALDRLRDGRDGSSCSSARKIIVVRRWNASHSRTVNPGNADRMRAGTFVPSTCHARSESRVRLFLLPKARTRREVLESLNTP